MSQQKQNQLQKNDSRQLIFRQMKNRKSITNNFQLTKKMSQLNIVQKSRRQNKISNTYHSKPEQSSQKSTKFPSVKYSKIIADQNYVLNEIIGEGAFAKVRIGYRKEDGMVCVIKSYEKYRMNSQQKKKSISKEIQILKKISHPSIIKIIDSYETQESINIVMQHFSNHSLASYTKQNQPLEEQTLRNITKSIAQALVYLHDNKISHRDLKPQNILINCKQQIKIIDLGLAMMGDHDQMIVAGTPQFMCPQLINKKKFNPYKADIWAFGILLYWLTLGYFPQNNCKKLKSINKPTTFQLKFPVDIHPGIQYLIEKMLEIDPDQRIQATNILEDSWIKPRNFRLQIQKLVKAENS